MKSLLRSLAPIVLACSALMLSGCFSRQLIHFGTNASKPVVLLETIDSSNYVFMQTHEHVFWSCVEAGTELSCSRRCGSGTDLRCPEISVFNDSVGTNTR